MKKIILIVITFILGAYLLWLDVLSSKTKAEKQLHINTPHNIRTLSLQKKKKNTSHKEMTYQKVLADGLSFCPQLEKIMTNEDKITSSHTFAHNIHFKKANAIHRIRIFTEDGDDRSFQKLVYFVEDQDGFPQIKPIDDKKSINPDEDYILFLLHGTKTIFDSLDVTYYLSSGKSFNASYKNGKITRVTADQVDCQI